MRIKLARILDELREDHQNLTRLLDLLENECRDVPDDGEPDMELLLDIMHYMTVYPDAVHHPKEDRLYAEVRIVRPDLSSGFERITADHRHIAELSLTLKNDIASINSGTFVRRKAVVGNALRYVNTLRGHMQWEELDLFRRVDEMIAAGHTIISAASFMQSSDPVFGPEVSQNFARLVGNIEEYAASLQ